jgi:EAL and modified HD-GYP domain-containing signal transduction protein
MGGISMLALLRGIWRGANEAQAQVEPLARKPAALRTAPLPEAIGDPTSEFMRRESLMDREERIAGYAFSLFARLQDRLNQSHPLSRRAFDLALLMRLSLHGGDSLLGERLAFVSLAADSLSNPMLEDIAACNTELMLECTQTESTDWRGLGAHNTAVSEQGFLLDLHIHASADTACPLMGCVDMVQIEAPAPAASGTQCSKPGRVLVCTQDGF